MIEAKARAAGFFPIPLVPPQLPCASNDAHTPAGSTDASPGCTTSVEHRHKWCRMTGCDGVKIELNQRPVAPPAGGALHRTSNGCNKGDGPLKSTTAPMAKTSRFEAKTCTTRRAMNSLRPCNSFSVRHHDFLIYHRPWVTALLRQSIANTHKTPPRRTGRIPLSRTRPNMAGVHPGVTEKHIYLGSWRIKRPVGNCPSV